MLHIGGQKYVVRSKVTYVGDVEEHLLEGREVINVCPEGKEPKAVILTDDNKAFLTFLSSWSIARRYGGNDNE